MRTEDREKGRTEHDTLQLIAERIRQAKGPGVIVIAVEKLTGETGGWATRYGDVEVRVVGDEE